MRSLVWTWALAALLPLAYGYSFPSCIGYDVDTNLCSGFIRNYTYILPFMSHAYNFQDRVYNWTENAPANNTASQQNLAVDPALQGRANANTSIPNGQQVNSMYVAGYPLLAAAPGETITITWPRTAPADGEVADGSDVLNIYYYPKAAINAGDNFANSTEPTLPMFEKHHLATLAYNNNGSCQVTEDKTDLAIHCRGDITLPDLPEGIYTFLWYWVINNTGPIPVNGAGTQSPPGGPLYLEYPFLFEVSIKRYLAPLAPAPSVDLPLSVGG